MSIDTNYVRQHYITGNKFRDLADHEFFPGQPIPAASRLIFCKTDYYEHAVPHLSALQHKFVLITHNGDIPATPERAAILPENCVTWFAQNNLSQSDRVVSIPIGIANSEWQHGDINAIIGALGENPPNEGLAYFSVNTRTTPIRELIADYYRQQPWCAKGTGFHPYSEYCKTVRKYSYNISPPGNGADCHRHWETLYLGRTPVVQLNYGMIQFQQLDLPILWVNDIMEIEDHLLIGYREHFRKTSSNPELLKAAFMPYWEKRIGEAFERTFE